MNWYCQPSEHMYLKVALQWHTFESQLSHVSLTTLPKTIAMAIDCRRIFSCSRRVSISQHFSQEASGFKFLSRPMQKYYVNENSYTYSHASTLGTESHGAAHTANLF